MISNRCMDEDSYATMSPLDTRLDPLLSRDFIDEPYEVARSAPSSHYAVGYDLWRTKPAIRTMNIGMFRMPITGIGIRAEPLRPAGVVPPLLDRGFNPRSEKEGALARRNLRSIPLTPKSPAGFDNQLMTLLSPAPICPNMTLPVTADCHRKQAEGQSHSAVPGDVSHTS